MSASLLTRSRAIFSKVCQEATFDWLSRGTKDSSPDNEIGNEALQEM